MYLIFSFYNINGGLGRLKILKGLKSRDYLALALYMTAYQILKLLITMCE
jgi:hypothetical protein